MDVATSDSATAEVSSHVPLAMHSSAAADWGTPHLIRRFAACVLRPASVGDSNQSRLRELGVLAPAVAGSHAPRRVPRRHGWPRRAAARRPHCRIAEGRCWHRLPERARLRRRRDGPALLGSVRARSPRAPPPFWRVGGILARAVRLAAGCRTAASVVGRGHHDARAEPASFATCCTLSKRSPSRRRSSRAGRTGPIRRSSVTSRGYAAAATTRRSPATLLRTRARSRSCGRRTSRRGGGRWTRRSRSSPLRRSRIRASRCFTRSPSSGRWRREDAKRPL